jgi:O-antigen/teichoic acid export membrane protein
VTENGAAPAPRASTKEKAQTAVPFVVASGLLRIIVSLVGLLLLVRYLPQEEYGVWVLLTGLAIPLGLFTSLGFQQSLMRFMPALPDGPPRAERLWAVIGGRLALATCASLALTMSFSWIAPRFGLDGHLASFLAVQPGIVLMCVTVYATAGLNVAFRQREAFIAAFVQQTLFLATVAGGIGTGQGLIYFAGAYSVTSAAHLAVSLAYCVRVYGRPRLGELARRPSEPGEEVRYRRTSYVNEVAGSFLSPDISRYLLAAFSTTLEVAVYAVATSIVLRLRSFQPMEIFRPLATVSVFERFEQTGRVDELNKSFRFLYTANHLVTAFYVALFLPLGAQTLAWVFRDEYVSSYLPALFFFLSLALFGMPVGLLAHALRRPQFLIYSKAAVLVNVFVGAADEVATQVDSPCHGHPTVVFIRDQQTVVRLIPLVDLRPFPSGWRGGGGGQLARAGSHITSRSRTRGVAGLWPRREVRARDDQLGTRPARVARPRSPTRIR